VLPGGDAAAEHPVQAAAGFLTGLDGLPDLAAPPFSFPDRYAKARELIAKGLRTFPTTSVGRLFDTMAALLGFTRRMTFEGQAAIWLEQLARGAATGETLPFSYADGELDFRPALTAAIEARRCGGDPAAIARAYHRGLAQGMREAIVALAAAHGVGTVVLSGGVFQNELLLEDLKDVLASTPFAMWSNREVPANDGGISLGQAALAALRNGDDLAWDASDE
jgi:hydrogenase maturation protein HypF